MAWPANDLAYLAFGSVLAGMVLGAVVLAGAVFTAAWLRWRRPGWGGMLATFGLMLLAMVIATALAAAYSRIGAGIPEGANKKYASFAALGWLGVFMIGAGLARTYWAARPLAWRQAPLWGAMLVMLPFVAAGAAREEALWQKWIDRDWENAMAIFTEVDSLGAFVGIYSAPMSELAPYREFILSKQQSIFAHYDFRMGDGIEKATVWRVAVPCLGKVEVKATLPEDDKAHVFSAPGTAAILTGWTWLVKDNAPATDVVVADAAGKIVGLAHTTRPSLVADDTLGTHLKENAGWLGYVRTEQPTVLTFYALSGDGRSYCKFAELP